jgi:hypothetical protein
LGKSEAGIEENSVNGTTGEGETAVALIFCSDLMFAVRLQNMAKKSGYKPFTVRSGMTLAGADVLLVDIADRGDWEEACRRASAAGMTVIAFGPHMDSEGRARAKAAGAKRVLANSNLERDLPGILRELRNSFVGGEDGAD